MQVVLAHSNERSRNTLNTLLLQNDVRRIAVFKNGFETLAYVIQNKPKILIIEENLPGLNAKDIETALRFKGIKIKTIIVRPYDNSYYMLFISRLINYWLGIGGLSGKIDFLVKNKCKNHDSKF